MGTRYSRLNQPAGPRIEYGDDLLVQNLAAFESLKQDPKYSDFFSFTFPDMKVGKMLGAGAQARICEGEFTLGTQKNFPCALKIFDSSESLSRLREQWPEGMLAGGNSVFPGYFSGTSSILGGLVLEGAGQGGRYDGRFAIVMRREWGDLRKLIDLRIKTKNDIYWKAGQQRLHDEPVFSDACAKKMMLEIAMGMRQLHNHGILHRDLKSLNVLVCTPYPRESPVQDDAFHVKVFDFESSVGIEGTIRWMPPEVLEHRLHREPGSDFEFTSKQDVYSYALTCYEILTGHLPFEEVIGRMRDIGDIVREGGRPDLPSGMDEWLRELLQRCWHPEPSQRPEFEHIVNIFKARISDPRVDSVQEQIAASKSCWTETDASESTNVSGCEEEKEGETNQEIFARLKKNSNYSRFLSYEFRNLELGRKIAQGQQGEVFEAEFEKANGIKVPCVVKLFGTDFSLLQAVNQWPPGMLNTGGADSSTHRSFGFMGLYPGATRTCEVLGAAVLHDDRFAFIFNPEGGDLRSLIDGRMKHLPSNRSRPFTITMATKIIYEIALGMLYLHGKGILHRDLKAANVLVTNVFGEFPSVVDEEPMDVKVADFECSMLTVGTAFWRAPEILRQLGTGKPLVFTPKADVYSFGMTCYEVLEGGVPLHDVAQNDYAAIYNGQKRPILPDHVDGWLRKLIERCWHLKPTMRPDFKEIVRKLESNCSHLSQAR